MARSKTWTGIDIGSTGVRAAKVAGIDDDGFAVIERFAVIPLRGDAVMGGKIRNQAMVAQAVKKAAKSVGASSSSIIMGLSAPEQGVSRIALPAGVKAAERVAALRTMQVQVAATVPTAEAAISTNFVREENTADGRRVAALVVGAAINSEVENLVKICSLSGIDPRAVDLSGAGTLRALIRDLPNSRDSATIVDIGATTTSIIAREGLHIRSVRSFTGGGLDLTRAIAAAARESLEDAERRKYAMRLSVRTQNQNAGYGSLHEEEDIQSRVGETAIERALSTAADLLVDQIAQTVESDLGASQTRHVALCGGASLMRGLKERLQRRLALEVRIGHPWARLERTKHNVEFFHNGREDPRVMLLLSTATGLALWRDAQ
jgi:Tfp pilus assembly PilM family ATPase